MKKLAKTQHLAGRVEFLGPLSKAEIAEAIAQADALLHPSNYETFSVVCAESISINFRMQHCFLIHPVHNPSQMLFCICTKIRAFALV